MRRLSSSTKNAPLRIAHQVAADDVGVDAERHVDAAQLAPVARGAEHQLGRHHALLQDALLVVDVVQEQVQRPDALLEAALDAGATRPA